MTVPAVDLGGGELASPANIQWSRDLVQQIAKDVGDAVVMHIEAMYPAALAAAPTSFQLSVRNTVINEIMAAIDVNDASQIVERLANRKRARRKLKAAYRKMRSTDKV